jgi:cobalt-zinc-cadmium efflux system membrane fusion protein
MLALVPPSSAQERTTAAVGDGIVVPKESQILLGVLTEIVAARVIRTRIVTTGQVVPRSDRHAELFAAQPGRLGAPSGGRLPFIGEHVRRGQTLAVIDASLSATDLAQLGSQRIQVDARVGQAQAELRQAERDLERARALSGVVSQRELQAAELAVEVAGREHERAVRERNLVGGGRGGRLSRFAVVAPFDGVIAETEHTVGQQVDPSRSLFTLIDPTVVWVEARVVEADLGRIQPTADASISVEAYPGVDFEGRLFALAPQVDPASRSAKAIFEVPNEDGRLRPGMFATVRIGAGPGARSVAVPDSAIVSQEGRQFVFLHTAPETFLRREVSLGTRDGQYWSVRGGLEGGERVVTQGVHQLRSMAAR